jgi:predicted PurR-regulated permease PerM
MSGTRQADRGAAQQPAPGGKTPVALGVLAAVVALYFARDVLIPLALQLLLTFLLAPWVGRLERWRVPRVLAVTGVVGLSVIVLGAAAWMVEGQLVTLAGRLPEYKTNIERKLEAFRPPELGALAAARKTIAELGHDIDRSTAETDAPKLRAGAEVSAAAAPAQSATPDAPIPVRLVEPPTALVTYARSLLGPLLAPLTTAFLVIVLTSFMLIKREQLGNRLTWLVESGDLGATPGALDEAAQRVSRYLRMQLIVNGATGLLIGSGLFCLGVPGAALWGFLAALLRFVPFVGIWVAASFPLMVSVAVSPGWTQPALTLALFAVVEFVCGNVIEPLLYGAGTGLTPLAILASAVFWTWLWGGAGLLLSTPLTVCLAVIGRHVPRLRFLDLLLGDDPMLAPAVRRDGAPHRGSRIRASRSTESPDAR